MNTTNSPNTRTFETTTNTLTTRNNNRKVFITRGNRENDRPESGYGTPARSSTVASYRVITRHSPALQPDTATHSPSTMTTISFMYPRSPAERFMRPSTTHLSLFKCHITSLRLIVKWEETHATKTLEAKPDTD